jgi:hypothetical protein
MRDYGDARQSGKNREVAPSESEPSRFAGSGKRSELASGLFCCHQAEESSG